MGIGVAHGRAVAGKIGTRDRMTVTVFGPVVDIAARLEGLTKRLRAPIILDEATSDLVRSMIAEDEGRLRTLARVLPYGMETPVLVSELLPPEEELPELTSRHLRVYSEGVRQFIAGKWEEAYKAFHEMPSSDRAQDFLLAIIAQHARKAPPSWTGTIELPHK
jgi:adenylate cyclase